MLRRIAWRCRGIWEDSVDVALRATSGHLREAFAVTSHLTTRERLALYELAAGKAVVCEIGSYIGASACCFGAAFKKMGRGTLVCIDTWKNDAMTEGNRDTFSEFSRNTAAFAEYIVPVRGFSTEVIGSVAQRFSRLDLLFIDGDHSYSGVKADWDTYSPLLGVGSIVVFHDSGWADGVQRVIEEDAKPRVFREGSLPNMWWGTVRN